MSETPQYPTSHQPTEQAYQHHPPKRAVHGPWPLAHNMTGKRRLDMKQTIVSRIDAGECDCHCCRYAGKPAGLPDGYTWARQPTPKQLREKGDRYPISYLYEWPLWILTRG